MSLNWISETIKKMGVTIIVKGADLQLSKSASKSPKLIAAVRSHKQELLAIVQDKMVRNVGNCNHCGGELIGFLTFDGYTNLTCPSCGKWFRCLKPLMKETMSFK